ncbi:MAG: hypothetical protein ACO3WK_12605, partial [Steroidobacteraceae bacterium]
MTALQLWLLLCPPTLRHPARFPLTAHGRLANTPAAVIENGSGPGQSPSRYDGCQAVQFIGRRIVDPTRPAEAIDA